MQQFILKKEVFDTFVRKVMESREFIAPIKGRAEDHVERSFYSSIDSPDQIIYPTPTYYPVKGYFFPPKETLFEFEGNKLKDAMLDIPERVFFALRRCDLNGIMNQDTVFLEETPDPHYKARRDKALLIGLHCKVGGEHCFCNAFDLKNFFDLMFYDKQDIYAVEVGTNKGHAFVKEFSKFFEAAENAITDDDRKTENKKALRDTDIKGLYDNPTWKKGAEKCLSCGACTALCPNCHCFTINDEVNLDLKSGKRVREPASCQLRNFTRVAGDHVFRDQKLARFKHRIYHQMQYFKDRHGVNFCTGCGRCIFGCPAHIDWVELINEMKNDNKRADN